MPAIVSSPYFCLFQLTSPAKAVYCIKVWQLGWEIHFQHAQEVKTFMRYWSLKTAVYHSQSAHVYPPGWCVALHRKKDTAGGTGRRIIHHFYKTWKYLPLREASCLVFFFSAMPRKYFHLSRLVVLWGGFLSVVISQTKCELISTKPGLVIIASLFSFVGCHALLMAVRYFTGLAVGGCACSHRSGPCLVLKNLLTLGFTKWLGENVLFRPTFGVAFLSAAPISQAPWTNVWQGLILFGPIWLSGIVPCCFISPPRPYLLYSYSGTLIPLLDASHTLETDHICLFFLHKRPRSTFFFNFLCRMKPHIIYRINVSLYRWGSFASFPLTCF